ncbi:hypothetical protein OHA25_32820 [Nonomuraea sp. NBC_00507]|uniref:hypothetical protein n=1 Tax=Nonomuraea sp. NBC_00507 TaxID=2976002 RepID=UPI002E18CB7C
MSEQMRKLAGMVGTWQLSGGAKGTVRFEWMEGGFFLLQHVDLVHEGRQIKGLEVIGHERLFGAEPSEEIKSRFYDSTGNTLDYVYEPHDDGSLTIWGGEKGSPAYCRTTVGEDGDSFTASWVWPGGGYDTIGTRTDR